MARESSDDTVRIQWWPVTVGDQELIDSTVVLYSYVTLDGQIVYVGKADRSTVWERYRCGSKGAVWRRINAHFGKPMKCFVIVGDLTLPRGRRLSRALLADIETLLINNLRPVGNRSAISTRISRPGLRVVCRGVWWPLSVRTFRDR